MKDKKEIRKSEKKPVFSKKTDDAINGFAVGVSLLAIGIFLLMKPYYFHFPLISYILGVVIGLIGFFGAGLEITKTLKVKGLDNVAIGTIFFVVWIITYVKISALWSNIVFFILLVLGAYSICLGTFQVLYSFFIGFKNSRNKGTNKASVFSQMVLFLTQVCGLAVAVFNVLKAINIIQ